MKITLHVPDDLFEKYVLDWGIPGCYNKMKENIAILANLEKGGRFLLLDGADRRAVEAVFQTTLDTPARLLKELKNLCAVRIAGVEVALTTEQLQRINAQAGFHGRTTETYIQETVTELLARFMEEV